MIRNMFVFNSISFMQCTQGCTVGGFSSKMSLAKLHLCCIGIATHTFTDSSRLKDEKGSNTTNNIALAE